MMKCTMIYGTTNLRGRGGNNLNLILNQTCEVAVATIRGNHHDIEYFTVDNHIEQRKDANSACDRIYGFLFLPTNILILPAD